MNKYIISSVLRHCLFILLITLNISIANAQTEDWNCTNSTNPDCDLDWSITDGGGDIISNRWRHDHNLSVLVCNSCTATSDYDIEVDVEAPNGAGNYAGISWKYTNNTDRYLGGVFPQSNLGRILRWFFGNPSVLCSGAYTIDPGTVYTVKVEVRTNTYYLYINGSSICSTTNTTHTGTGVGTGQLLQTTPDSGGGEYSIFDNWVMTTVGGNSVLPLIKDGALGNVLVR